MKTFAFIVKSLGDDEQAKALWQDMKDETGNLETTLKYHAGISVAMLLIDGTVESVIFYVPLPEKKIATIGGEFTRPESRNRGYFTILFDLLQDFLYETEEDIDNIQSGYYHGDDRGQHILERLGFKAIESNERHTRMHYWLKNPWRPHRPVDGPRITHLARYLYDNRPKTWLTRFREMLWGRGKPV